MKIKILLLALFITAPCLSDEIIYNENNCNTQTLNSSNVLCSPSRKVVEMDQTNSDQLLINSWADSGDLFTYIMGHNNRIDYSTSSSDPSPFGKSLLIFDKTDNLVINARGFNGTNGTSAGDLCRDRMKGSWGTKWSEYYSNKYGPTSNAPCDNADQQKIFEEEFTCDPGFTESFNGKVSVQFMDYKRQCKANIVKNVCLKKTYNITCKLLVKGDGCCGYSGPTSHDSMNDSVIPYNIIPFTASKSCDHLSCGSGRNGISLNYTFTNRDLNEVNDANFCATAVNTSSMQKPTITLSNGGLDYFQMNDAQVATQNLPAITARDQNNNIIPATDYKLYLINGSEIKNSNLRNCLGFSGSSFHDLTCDYSILGSPITLKFRAISKDYAVSNIFQYRYTPPPPNVVCSGASSARGDVVFDSSCTDISYLGLNQNYRSTGFFDINSNTTFRFKYRCPTNFSGFPRQSAWAVDGGIFGMMTTNLTHPVISTGNGEPGDGGPMTFLQLEDNYGCIYIP